MWTQQVHMMLAKTAILRLIWRGGLSMVIGELWCSSLNHRDPTTPGCAPTYLKMTWIHKRCISISRGSRLNPTDGNLQQGQQGQVLSSIVSPLMLYCMQWLYNEQEVTSPIGFYKEPLNLSFHQTVHGHVLKEVGQSCQRQRQYQWLALIQARQINPGIWLVSFIPL